MTLKSYDENQLDTVLRECPQCKRSRYLRPWRVICVECSGWQPVAITERVERIPREA